MKLKPIALPASGDMDPAAFHEAALTVAGWIRDYLSTPERWPVSPRVAPGSVRAAFPSSAPEDGESMARILDDFQRILIHAITHWNHPGFLAYFPSSGSGPGILAEFLSAALNQQAMLWRTSPAATELEAVALAWLRQLLKLPDAFEGVIYDTGSTSNLHALIAAREVAAPEVRSQGLAGRPGLSAFRIYCSEQAHLSIEKAAIVLGLGRNAVCRIPTDAAYRLRPSLLDKAIVDDRAAGKLPVAVVATVGATGTGSVDPVRPIAEICGTRGVWLHVDAAYGGVAAMLPEHQWIFEGAGSADSVMVNPPISGCLLPSTSAPSIPAESTCSAARCRSHPSTWKPASPKPDTT